MAITIRSAIPALPAIALLLLLSCKARAEGQQEEVRARMNELVDSVKGAVDEVESAGKKREVVDLGQSLHLLENKFAGLRAALSQEMGVKANTLATNSNVAKELMDQSSSLVKGIVGQREELRKLVGDITQVDSAVRALREGLTVFEKDVADLHKIMGELHVSHNELSTIHSEAKTTFQEIMADTKTGSSSSHSFFYALILIEIALFVGFLYFKRRGGVAAHKAYGKFG